MPFLPPIRALVSVVGLVVLSCPGCATGADKIPRVTAIDTTNMNFPGFRHPWQGGAAGWKGRVVIIEHMTGDLTVGFVNPMMTKWIICRSYDASVRKRSGRSSLAVYLIPLEYHYDPI